MRSRSLIIMTILGIILLSAVCTFDCSSAADTSTDDGTTIETSDKLVMSMVMLFVYAPLIITIVGAICLLIGLLSGSYPLISFGKKAFIIGLILILIKWLSIILLGTTIPWWYP